MMQDFLFKNRAELIQRCRQKVSLRTAPKASNEELQHGVPLFLDQLIKTLQVEQTAGTRTGEKIPGPSGGAPVHSELDDSAALHGVELMQQGFTIEQVVHDYGDLCQAITDLAFETGAAIKVDEFRTLNRCLDNAIASAVAEYSSRHDAGVADRTAMALNERLGYLAHELRDHINTATLAFTALKLGNVGVMGATGAVLDRSLIGLRTVIDRSLTDVRMSAGLPARPQRIAVADFVANAKVSASLEAQRRACGFVVQPVDATLAVDVDPDLLYSAIGNLLQNAFKFTAPHTDVTLNAYAAGDRIRIDVQDQCGGLPVDADKMFMPFKQLGTDKSGLGLGLSICQRSVEANNGTLSVRDIPGSGCVFTIDLPRQAL